MFGISEHMEATLALALGTQEKMVWGPDSIEIDEQQPNHAVPQW